jgi:excisionase family DNA binding protein
MKSLSPVDPTQAVPRVLAVRAEPFVDPDTAANYLRTTRRHVLEMVREGLIPGHPLDPHAKKKDWRFLLSELHAYMLRGRMKPERAWARGPLRLCSPGAIHYTPDPDA